MNDLNFFEVSKDQEDSGSSRKVSIIGGTVLGAFIISTLMYNTMSTIKTNKEIESINATLNDASIKSQYEESLDIQKQKETLTVYYDKVSSIFESVVSRDKVSPQFMAAINATIPEGVSFKSMNFSNGMIQIAGESSSRQAIAEFQHNMNELKFIKESHVSNITSDLNLIDESFSFSINCNLEEEYYNENK